MSDYYNKLAARLRERFANQIDDCNVHFGQVNLVVKADQLLDVCRVLRDDAEFAFEELIDLCGVDYSDYQQGKWSGKRFAVAYQLLSIKHNHRLRLRCFADDDSFPKLDSVIEIWNAANWFEREAFDLYGIVFDGHPDLRRILTDYGFIGHPFRKDFPLSGNVEMRYDAEKQRVVYQPVSIDLRINQPRVIRDDHRYADRVSEED